MAVSFGILLLLITPSYSFQPAYADNTIKAIAKVEGTFPADTAVADFDFVPFISDIDKAIIFMTFAHAGENDHSDTFRSWELIDGDTLRIKGENTATGNVAQDFFAYIIQFDGTIETQHLNRVTVSGEGAGEKSVTIPTAINTTNSFIVTKGHHHNASETTIGSEELDRIRIIDSTNWGYFVSLFPNTGDQGNLVDVIDWNQDNISVQRGLHTLADQDNTDTVSPPTAIDRNRTILIVSYSNDFSTAIPNDDHMIQASITTGGDMNFTRTDNEGDEFIAWELIEFPANMVRVHHESITLLNGTFTATDTVTSVRDFDKTIAISSVATPYGYGAGSIDESTDTATFTQRILASTDDAEEHLGTGVIDLTSSDLELHDSGGGDGAVGMRWTGVTVPAGATITNAEIQFQVDEIAGGSSTPVTVTFAGELIADAPTFTSTNSDITARTDTSADVDWAIPTWVSVDDELPAQLTPDLSPIIQEIVDQGGWASGQDIVIMIHTKTAQVGSGVRTAESFDGEAGASAELSITYIATAGGTVGAIDRGMTTIEMIDNDKVFIERGDSTGILNLDYQVIEFIEPVFPENAQGTNTIRQIVKLSDIFTAGNTIQQYTISPPLINPNKTITLFSMRGIQSVNVPEVAKSWEIVDGSTFRVHGTHDSSQTNQQAEFIVNFIEFDSASPIFVQKDQLQFAEDPFDGVKNMTMSTLNATGSAILSEGFNYGGGIDPTYGREEFGRFRIVNDTQWEWDIDTPANQEQIWRLSLIDFGQNDIFVQRGTASLSGTTLSVSPITDIDRDRTLLFATFKTTSGEFGEFPNRTAISGTIDTSVPPDLVFEREATGSPIEIAWQAITFPANFLSVQHGVHSQTDTVTNSTSTVTSVGNIANSLAIGTIGNPHGYGLGRGSTDAESMFNSTMATIELEDSTTVRVVRDDGSGTFDMGFQVLEFLTGGTVFDQDVLDTVTIAPDDPDFTIRMEAVDFSTSIDLNTDHVITKLGSDLASAGDTVNTNSIFVVELSDTGEATDVFSINVTKLNQELVSGLDDLDLDAFKQLSDTASVIDLVDANVVRLLLLTDTVSTNDEVRLAITKLFEDDVITSDEINFVVDKLLQDTAIVSDLANATSTFGVGEIDQISANDLVILDITKQLLDVASNFDDLELTPTKVFLDTTIVTDQSQALLSGGANVTDIVGVPDDITIDVTKLIQDLVTLNDQVVLLKLIDLALNDTVVVNDSVIFTVSAVPTNGTTGVPSGGGGAGIPTFQRLVGLAISSEFFHVAPADIVPSDFIIQTFGREDTEVSIVEIEVEQEFLSWFQFSSVPDPLDFDTTIDNTRTFTDPARFKNVALDDFVLNIPSLTCSELNPFNPPVSCVDPIIYQAELIFTFNKGGAEFREKHIVTIDAQTPIVCDPICQLVQFIIENWWWLAGIIVMFMVLYFIAGTSRNKGVRTARRINERHFNSFDAKPKVKFEKGKR